MPRKVTVTEPCKFILARFSVNPGYNMSPVLQAAGDDEDVLVKKAEAYLQRAGPQGYVFAVYQAVAEIKAEPVPVMVTKTAICKTVKE